VVPEDHRVQAEQVEFLINFQELVLIVLHSHLAIVLKLVRSV
jgi:hypothetical protein